MLNDEQLVHEDDRHGDGFQVGTRPRDSRVVIRVGLGVSMSQEAALTPGAARKHAVQVLTAAAGIQGRKVLALAAEGGMALFELAADIEDCLQDAISLDGITDAQWYQVARVIGGAGTRSLLENLWDQAGKALEG